MWYEKEEWDVSVAILKEAWNIGIWYWNEVWDTVKSEQTLLYQFYVYFMFSIHLFGY